MKYSIALLLFVAASQVLAAPELKLKTGTVQGVDIKSQTNQKTVHAFYSIPYAEPPVGKLRFRPPVPFTNSDADKVISRESFGPACLQMFSALKMDEDCLTLNVFVPGEKSDKPRSVALWIHGGGYVNGDASTYVPSDLVAENDIIVVVMQYRLQHFGFTGNGEGATLNNGLRDMLLSVDWVNDNIAAFGGNPDDVTLYGESAGASAISLLALSPAAKGKFHKSIVESGVANSPWSYNTHEVAVGKFDFLAKELGCDSADDVVECLQEKPAGDFLKNPNDSGLVGWIMQLKPPADPNVGAPVVDMPGSVDIRPAVDGDIIPDLPEKLMKDAAYLEKVGALERSYVIGSNNYEGSQFAMPPVMGYYNSEENLHKLIDLGLDFLFPGTGNDAMKDAIEFMYGYPRDANGRPQMRGLLEFQTDMWFYVPAIRFLEAMVAAKPDLEIYQYVFDYKPQLANGQRLPGLPHAGDLIFIFDNNDELISMITHRQPMQFNMTDINLMRTAAQAGIAQYVKTSNKGPEATIDWPVFDNEERSFLDLGTHSQAHKHAVPHRILFWDSYIPELEKMGQDC